MPGLDGKVVNAGNETIELRYYQLRLRNGEMNNTWIRNGTKRLRWMEGCGKARRIPWREEVDLLKQTIRSGWTFIVFLEWECESTKFFNTPDKMVKIFFWYLNDRILLPSRY